jgi:hypothetical protein
VELSVEVRPVGGLKIGGWVSLSDARITQSFPLAVTSAGIYAVDGSRLPDSPRLSGNLSVDEEFTVANGVTASVGGTETYVGNRVGGFSSDAATPLDIFSAYAKLDLHAALRFGSWTASVFGTNVVNRNGSLSGNPGTESYSPIPPRLVGINITKTFGHQ